MKNQITFLILFILLGFCSLQAQVSQEWVQRYNGPENGHDDARSLAVDDSGNVYVTGLSSSTPAANYATIKYNSSGDSLWVARYNGGVATSLAVDGSGNVYVTGGSGGGYVTIKYNSSGVQQWVQTYGPGNSYASSLAVDSSGNVYVTGISTGSGTGGDYATIKYNSSGVQQWVQRYNGPGNSGDGATSLAVDVSGNVYVTGVSAGSGTSYDYATIKYNSSGVQQWVLRYGPVMDPKLIDLPSLAVDDSGNVYVAGSSYSSGTNYDYITIKYGAQGWVQRYNGPSNNFDASSSLAVDGSGNVYVTGSSYDDCATIKYNSSGDSLWVARYNGPGNIKANSLAVDGSGNVYVTGESYGSGPYADYATIKYNSSGVQQWVQTYNGPGNGNDVATSLAVDGSENVYVTGGSDGSGQFPDYATIKYSQLTGISQTNNIIPEKFCLSQNYPNPFNPVTILEFGISSAAGGLGFVSLKIYDMLGKEVATLVNTNLNPGTYKYNFDASSLPSGVYFYKLVVDGNIIDTKRMMLLK